MSIITTKFIEFDHYLFRFINQSLANPIFDSIMPMITDLHKSKTFSISLLLFLIGYFIWKKRHEGVWIFFCTAISVGLADWLGGKWIKPFFARPRPPLALEDVIVRSPHFGGYSFISNHAANMFCLAVFVGFYFPRLRPGLIFIASLIAFSRVYNGVHFPSDVFFGGLLGAGIGYCMAKLCHYIYYNTFAKKRTI